MHVEFIFSTVINCILEDVDTHCTIPIVFSLFSVILVFVVTTLISLAISLVQKRVIFVLYFTLCDFTQNAYTSEKKQEYF